MQKPLIVSIVLTVAALIACIMAFSVWVGVFVGEDFYKDTYGYIRTNCTSSLINYDSNTCDKTTCDKSCYHECTEYPSCAVRNETLESYSCCEHSYHCCVETCKTCQTCSYKLDKYICENYECNCTCSSSVNSFACKVSFNTCYALYYSVSYTTLDKESLSVDKFKYCSDEACFNSTIESMNHPFECFYNPNDHYDISNYEHQKTLIPKKPFKVAIMYLFVGLTCLFFILFIIGVIVSVRCGLRSAGKEYSDVDSTTGLVNNK